MVAATLGASLAIAFAFVHWSPAAAATFAAAPLAAIVLVSRREAGLLVGIGLALSLPAWWVLGFQQLAVFRLASVLALVSVVAAVWKPRFSLVDALLLAFSLDLIANAVIQTTQPGLGRLLLNSFVPLAFYISARACPIRLQRAVITVVVIAATVGCLSVILEDLRGTVLYTDPSSYSWPATSTALFRPGGVFGSPPAAGTVAAMSLLLLQPLLAGARGRRKVLLMVCGAVLLVALIVTFERTAFIAVTAGFALYKILQVRDAGTALRYVLVTGAVLLSIIMLLPHVQSNSTFQKGLVRPGNLVAREDIWRRTIPIVTSSPQIAVNGVGFGATELAREGGSPPPALGTSPGLLSDSIHSQYFLLLLETGAVGLVLFIALLGTLLLRGARAARRQGSLLVAGMTAALLAFCVLSSTGTPVLDPSNWILVLLVAGLLATSTDPREALEQG